MNPLVLIGSLVLDFPTVTGPTPSMKCKQQLNGPKYLPIRKSCISSINCGAVLLAAAPPLYLHPACRSPDLRRSPLTFNTRLGAAPSPRLEQLHFRGMLSQLGRRKRGYLGYDLYQVRLSW